MYYNIVQTFEDGSKEIIDTVEKAGARELVNEYIMTHKAEITLYRAYRVKSSFGHDANGNRKVSIKVGCHRAFSVQTAGNLPISHREGVLNVDELRDYIDEFGTKNQKEIMLYVEG